MPSVAHILSSQYSVPQRRERVTTVDHTAALLRPLVPHLVELFDADDPVVLDHDVAAVDQADGRLRSGGPAIDYDGVVADDAVVCRV